MRPSPSGPPLSSSSLPGGRARARRARPRAPATSSLPGCLLLPLDVSRAPRTRPRPSLTLPCLSLRPYPPLLSLPPATERSPSPPTSARAAAAIPKPLRHALELRRSSLVLLVVSRDQKSPGTPPPTFSPSPAAEDLLRRFGHSGAPPSPLTLPTAPR